MLQRVQLLLEPEDKRSLERIAKAKNRSVSSVVREMLGKEIKKSPILKKTGIELLKEWASHPVKGPGDSEYDKYAYDLD
jgi:hypothetical protein